jgi:cytochrome bd-type quinol oxidase subunit 2
MENLIFWQTFWFYTIMFIFVMYTILDGFDLGAGVLLPFFRKKDVSMIIDTIHPYWDANEVWLIIGMGSIFAVFPQSLGSFLSGFYLPFLFVIFLFIFRAVSFGFHYHGGPGRRLCEVVIAASSCLIVILFLLVLGILYHGVDINTTGVIALGSTDIFTTVSIIFILTGVPVFAFHGLTYLDMKTDGDIQQRVKKIGGMVKFITAASIIIFFIFTVISRKSAGVNPLFITGGLVAIAGSVMNIFLFGSIYKKTVFALSSLSLIGIWIAVAGTYFPNTIASSADMNLSLTVFNSSSGLVTMKTLMWILIPVAVCISCISAFVYKVMGKDINTTTPNHKINGAKVMKEYMICKACGYVMEKSKVKDQCPACGVPAKNFEPYKEIVSPKRKLLLSLDLHPVLVHFPQAITALIFIFLPLSMILPQGASVKLVDAAVVLSYILPFTVLFAFIAGLFDGKIRFRRITTPLLIRKMIIGGLFMILSTGLLVIALISGYGSDWSIYSAIALSIASLGCGTVLALIGVGLLHAKFPG